MPKHNNHDMLLLILSCKLETPECLEPEKTLAERIKLRGHNFKAFARWLNSGDNVMELFPVPLLRPHIQVIVQVVTDSGEPMLCPVSYTC